MDDINRQPDIRKANSGDRSADEIVMRGGGDPGIVCQEKVIAPDRSPGAVKEHHPDAEVKKNTRHHRNPFHENIKSRRASRSAAAYLLENLAQDYHVPFCCKARTFSAISR